MQLQVVLLNFKSISKNNTEYLTQNVKNIFKKSNLKLRGLQTSSPIVNMNASASLYVCAEKTELLLDAHNSRLCLLTLSPIPIIITWIPINEQKILNKKILVFCIE